MSRVICLLIELSLEQISSMNSLPALFFCLANDLRSFKSELVACVQNVYGCEVGHAAVAYRHFVLFHPGI